MKKQLYTHSVLNEFGASTRSTLYNPPPLSTVITLHTLSQCPLYLPLPSIPPLSPLLHFHAYNLCIHIDGPIAVCVCFHFFFFLDFLTLTDEHAKRAHITFVFNMIELSIWFNTMCLKCHHESNRTSTHTALEYVCMCVHECAIFLHPKGGRQDFQLIIENCFFVRRIFFSLVFFFYTRDLK